jgi:phosphonatase-like hydrolase
VRPELFVFDMIGTTIEPSDAIPGAFRSALSNAGLHLSDDEISAVRGKSKREAIAELLASHLEQDDVARLQEPVYAAFQSSLEEHYRSGAVRPIEGAAEAFEWCRSVGAKIALTTGFDSNVADLLIESLGWAGKVDTLICNDDVESGRPAPFLIREAMKKTGVDSSHRVAAIGDTVSDLEAGLNARVGWNFAVLTGAHGKERLSGVDGAIILESVADLPEYSW